MKAPSFQFYPGDWQRDTALRACSIPARGLWIEMLCIMHQATPYGHLTMRDAPITADVLARLVGAPAKDCERWLAELQAFGVFQLTDGGVVYSPRMVRDEAKRQARAAGGKLGGNPALLAARNKAKDNHADKPGDAGKDSSKDGAKDNPKVNLTANLAPTFALTPSSSSSTSVNKEEHAGSPLPAADAAGAVSGEVLKVYKGGKGERVPVATEHHDPLGFEWFWQLYDYKQDAPAHCLPKWRALSVADRQRIMDGLPNYVAHCRRDAGHNYQLYPAKFLSKRKWEAEDWSTAPPPPAPARHVAPLLPLVNPNEGDAAEDRWGKLTPETRAELHQQQRQVARLPHGVTRQDIAFQS